jgi:hypothetical protein
MTGEGMMKTRFLMAIVVSLAALSPVSANANPPTDVVIHLHACSFDPTQVGIWDASGAINDSGNYERNSGFSSPPDRPFESTGPIHEIFVLTGVNGTFSVTAEERVTTSAVEGVWHIDPTGSRDYAETSGHGEFAFSVAQYPSCWGPLTFTVTLTGVASKIG